MWSNSTEFYWAGGHLRCSLSMTAQLARVVEVGCVYGVCDEQSSSQHVCQSYLSYEIVLRTFGIQTFAFHRKCFLCHARNRSIPSMKIKGVVSPLLHWKFCFCYNSLKELQFHFAQISLRRWQGKTFTYDGKTAIFVLRHIGFFGILENFRHWLHNDGWNSYQNIRTYRLNGKRCEGLK